MKILELIQLVAQMRSTQRDYFSSRSRMALNKSKLLESQIDTAIAPLVDNDSAEAIFVRDSTQLGELFLDIGGRKHAIASNITDYTGVAGRVDRPDHLKSFEVASVGGQGRYRIVFAIEEI